jgi:hypothetical protein
MQLKIWMLMLCPLLGMAQMENYWQQEVRYKMDITLNSENHQFVGDQELTYFNNSPDTIHKVYYHLYFNAFQPGSMMDQRQRSLPDPDKRIGERILNLKPEEYGYHRIQRLSQGERELAYVIEQTVLKAELAEPIAPGDSTLLNMKFESQVPIQIRRSGRNNTEGIDYTMTQWFPKLAAYDSDGWHPDFYIAREFYADYGTFEVNIDIDADYVIAGTGILLNEEEIWHPGKEDKDGNAYWEMKKPKGKRRTWHFRAENVHDFAWAADPEYLRIRQKVSDTFELNHYFLRPYEKTWTRLPKFTAQFFELMNRQYGTYPYPQFSVIQGGDGGMEYPMCTMLKGTGNLKGLVGVTVHEAAHNWYYAIFGTNESRYPWMDEGFTSFTEEEILKIMWRDSTQNSHIQAYAKYLFLVNLGGVEPLSTPADSYERNRTYKISAYSRGALFLNQLRYIMGEKDFNRGMLEYYKRWKFKHPDPWDFIRLMEEVSDLELDWYLEYWVYTSKTIDYGIEGLEPEGFNSTRIQLKRYGEMPMPLEVRLKYTSGGEQTYFIPLSSMFGSKDSKWVTSARPWPWTHPTYDLVITKPMDQIELIEIDPNRFMSDVNLENNRWPGEEKKDD